MMEQMSILFDCVRRAGPPEAELLSEILPQVCHLMSSVIDCFCFSISGSLDLCISVSLYRCVAVSLYCCIAVSMYLYSLYLCISVSLYLKIEKQGREGRSQKTKKNCTTNIPTYMFVLSVFLKPPIYVSGYTTALADSTSTSGPQHFSRTKKRKLSQ